MRIYKYVLYMLLQTISGKNSKQLYHANTAQKVTFFYIN